MLAFKCPLMSCNIHYWFGDILLVYPTNRLQLKLIGNAVSLTGLVNFSVEFISSNEYLEPYNNIDCHDTTSNTPSKRKRRSVGGLPENGAPWSGNLQTYLNGKTRHRCGAVLLTPRIVLTAAHCISGIDPEDFENNLQTEFGNQVSDVLHWMEHPGYVNGGASSTDDAAVLWLLDIIDPALVHPPCWPDIKVFDILYWDDLFSHQKFYLVNNNCD